MKKYILIISILVGFSSCEKDADITIKEMPPQLVVSSMFSNNVNESYIKLTMSKGFKRDSYEYTPIIDAQIKVTDNQGNIINFTANADGVYKTNTPAIAGNDYTLDIVKDTHHLTANESMKNAVVLQDFELLSSQIRRGSSLVLQFDDPSTDTNYFRIKIYVEEINMPGSEYLLKDFVATDHLYNTQTHKLNVGRMRIYMSGTYKVHLLHISKNAYKYYDTLQNINNMGYGDSPFVSAVPGNPNTNIEGGIGYFATGAESVKEKLINVN
jgi:hypothetical protein